MTIDDFLGKLDRVIAKYPDESESALRSGANRMRKNLKEAWSENSELYHVRTGEIQKGWRTKYYMNGGNSEANISNMSRHYHLIERGHKKVTPITKRVVGWQPGTHTTKKIVQNSEMEVKAVMANRMFRLLKDKL